MHHTIDRHAGKKEVFKKRSFIQDSRSHRTLYSHVIKPSVLRSSDRLSSHSNIDLLFIPVEHGSALEMTVFKHIYHCRGKLARADFLLKQQVKFRERAAPGLGETEVRVDDAQEAGTAPEETGVVAPMCVISCRGSRLML